MNVHLCSCIRYTRRPWVQTQVRMSTTDGNGHQLCPACQQLCYGIFYDRLVCSFSMVRKRSMSRIWERVGVNQSHVHYTEGKRICIMEWIFYRRSLHIFWSVWTGMICEFVYTRSKTYLHKCKTSYCISTFTSTITESHDPLLRTGSCSA